MLRSRDLQASCSARTADTLTIVTVSEALFVDRQMSNQYCWFAVRASRSGKAMYMSLVPAAGGECGRSAFDPNRVPTTGAPFCGAPVTALPVAMVLAPALPPATYAHPLKLG